jgi:hypothetical protein
MSADGQGLRLPAENWEPPPGFNVESLKSMREKTFSTLLFGGYKMWEHPLKKSTLCGGVLIESPKSQAMAMAAVKGFQPHLPQRKMRLASRDIFVQSLKKIEKMRQSRGKFECYMTIHNETHPNFTDNVQFTNVAVIKNAGWPVLTL